MFEKCELFGLIPKEKLDYLFENSYASAELDYTFLGFEDVYKSILNFVPKNKIIVDLGCGYACQSYYFKDYKGYIGVDNMANEKSVIHTDNSTFYFESIQEFIHNWSNLGLNKENVFAICSYVPDKQAQQMVREFFPYCLVYYPNKP